MAYYGNQPVSGENNSFKVLDDVSSYTLTFDGSSTSVVSASDDTLTFYDHRFVQGQRVTYTDGGGDEIDGLTTDTAYYVIRQDKDTIKLATDSTNATNGTAINISLSGTSGSSHTLKIAFDGTNTKFKATCDGEVVRLTRAGQLMIAINNVVQQPVDSTSPSNGFGIDTSGVIVFSAAPDVNDTFWGNYLTTNLVSWDVTDNKVDTFTGNGSTTEFSLSKQPLSNKDVLVTIDGVTQYPTEGSTTRAYTVSGNSITFTSAPAGGTSIQVRHIGFVGATAGSGGVTAFYGRTGNVTVINTDNIIPKDVRAAGNLSVTGISTFTGDIDANADIELAGNLSVTGVSTFTGNTKVSGDLDVVGNLNYTTVTDIQATGIITASKGIQIEADGLNVEAGISTFAGDIDANADIELAGNIAVTGVSTFTGAIDANGALDVDGTSDLDQVNIAQGLNVTAGIATFAADIDANADIEVAGNLNVTGIITGASFSGIDSDKISEGNTEVEAVDTGSDGHIKFTTEGTERARIDSAGITTFGSHIQMAPLAELRCNDGDGKDWKIYTQNDWLKIEGVTSGAKINIQSKSDGLFLGDNGQQVIHMYGGSGGGTYFKWNNDTKLKLENGNWTYLDSCTVTHASDVLIPDKLVHVGDTNTALRFPAADTFTVETAGSERLRIGPTGISTFLGDLHAAQAGTGSTIFINSTTHNTNVGSVAMLKLGYTHSGGQAVGYLKVAEGGNNSFDATMTLGVPYNIGSGAFGTRDAVTIKHSSDVGIGTTSPQKRLEVYEGDIYLNSSDKKVYFSSDFDQYISANASSNFLTFAAGNGERMRINSAGQISIRGKTDAFDTTGDLDSLQLYYETDSGQASIGPYSSGGSTHLSFYTNASAAAAIEKLRIHSDGTVEVNPGNGTSNGLFVIGKDGSGEAQLRFSNASNNTASIRLNSSEELGVFYGGTEVVRIDSSGRLGVGANDPTEYIQIHESQNNTRAQITFTNNSTGATVNDGLNIGLDGSQNAIIHQHENTHLIFGTNDTERLRIASDGRVLIGTSSGATSGSTNNAIFTVCGEVDSATNPPQMNLWRNASISSGQELGKINFCGESGTGVPGATISAEADAEWNTSGDASDHPARIIFSTVPDGSSVATERMRITSGGVKQIKNGNLNILSTFIDFSGSLASTPQTAAAIFRPADNTLAFSTANEERLRIDSSGRIGIGDDSPTVAVSIKHTAPKIKFIDSDATGTPESLLDGSGGDVVIDVDKDNEKSSTQFQVKIDGSEKFRVTGDKVMCSTDLKVDSDNSHDIGASGAQWKDLYLKGDVHIGTNGKGIDFTANTDTPGGSVSASVVGNILDDYEEGHFEPEVHPSNNSYTSINMHGDTGGYYIKIGHMVWVTGCVRWSSLTKGDGADTVLVRVPFASMARSNGDNSDGPGPIRCGSSNGSDHPSFCAIKPDNANMYFFSQSGNQADTYEVSEQGTSCHFQYTLCYRAA